MKKLENVFVAVLIIIALAVVITGCRTLDGSKHDMTIKITSASESVFLFADQADVQPDSDTVKWILYNSEGDLIPEEEASISYKESFNAFYLQYGEFNLTFNTNLAAYYHLSAEHPCTQLEVDGTDYVSYDM